MSRVRGWLETLRAVFRRGEMDRELAEEFRFHVEREVESNIRAGMSPAEARAAALRKFGGEDRHAEATRDARGARWLDDLRSDLKLALRGFRRTPGASAAAVLTLAIGIGATVVVFGVVNGVLLEPLPYPRSNRLAAIWSRFVPESGFDFPQFPLSEPEFLDYAAQNETMDAVAAIATSGATLVDGAGEARRVSAASVSAEFFEVLGVEPALGRVLQAHDDVPGGSPVVVLSYGLWQSAFGGDPNVVGTTAMLDGPYEVVGVMPEGFSFPGAARDLWVPLGIDPVSPRHRTGHYLTAIGRLREGVPLERAEAEMTTLMARWEEDYPEIHTGHFLFLRDLTEETVGDVRQALWLVLGAVGVVLLLVCVNIAHVLLARGVTRNREMAVRVALGAAGGRLIRQTFAESGLLAFTGAALGLVLAYAAIGPVAALAEQSLPRVSNIEIDVAVVAFATLLAGFVALLAGLLPALRVHGADPQAALREGGRGGSAGPGTTRYRNGLVVAEVALACLVVVAAGLLGRSYRDLTRVDPGFTADGVLVLDLSLPARVFPDASDVVGFHANLRTRLAALPGVRSATALSALPLLEAPGNIDFVIENQPPPAPGEPATSADLITVMPGLEGALGFRLLEGRSFSAGDVATSMPVALVNRTAARMFFDGDAVGERLRLAGSDSLPWLTIAGVVDDVLYGSLDAPPRPAYYIPHAQSELSFGFPPRGMTFALRTAGDPLPVATAAREVVRELAPSLPIIRLDPMTRVVAESVARPRFTLSLFGAFALLALVLGALGIYGVLSYNVAERAREMGIRLALGARRSRVAGYVVARGLALAGIGLAVGLGLSLATARLLSGLLFGVAPIDPVSYMAAAVTLLAVAAVACAVPAVRAIRVDPARVLRDG